MCDSRVCFCPVVLLLLLPGSSSEFLRAARVKAGLRSQQFPGQASGRKPVEAGGEEAVAESRGAPCMLPQKSVAFVALLSVSTEGPLF